MTPWTEEQYQAHMREKGRAAFQDAQAASEPAKKSKYRNVVTYIGDERFDSKREADHWLVLKAREALKEIYHLRRQVVYELRCPTGASADGESAVVARYVADMVYLEGSTEHVVDVKGHRTREYLLKKRWLELQSGIVVEEI